MANLVHKYYNLILLTNTLISKSINKIILFAPNKD